jgi:hypothetical protein
MIVLDEMLLSVVMQKKTGDKTQSLIASRNEQVGARLKVVLPLMR